MNLTSWNDSEAREIVKRVQYQADLYAKEGGEISTEQKGYIRAGLTIKRLMEERDKENGHG
jgi:hypothetical protein